jgi:hypothetical protein
MRLSKKKTHKRYKKKLRGGVNPQPSHPSLFNSPHSDATPRHSTAGHPLLFNAPPSHPSLFNRPSLFPQPINPKDLTFNLYKYNAENITELKDYVIAIGLLDADNECFRNLYEREELPPNEKIFDMLYNTRTDLWICTDNTRGGTYVAHASVNYDTEIGNLMNFPKNNPIIKEDDRFNLIWNVCVSLAYRRKKICELLIKTIISRNLPNDLPFALNVVRGNTGAENCYKKSGFKFFTKNESMNIMTTIPDLPEYIPMETQDEEDVLCQGLSDIKLKGKMVFLYIISHGELLPLVIYNHAMLKNLERVSSPTISTNKIFPDIKGNPNLLNAANERRFKSTLFPFYLSDSKLKTATHTMNLIALESGCVSLINLDTNLKISNLLSTSVGDENLNRKVVFDTLTKQLNDYTNSFISVMVSQCLTGRKNPLAINYPTGTLLDTPSKQCERIQTQHIKDKHKIVVNKDAFKVAQNWPAMPQCVKPSERILQNNKVYNCVYNEIEAKDKEKYNQLIRFVKNDIKPGLELKNEEYYRKNPLIKLYFKTDGVDGKDVFLNVPTHEYITLTDVLNRVSYILGLYGMNNSEIVIVDSSCGHKDSDAFSYAGGTTKKKKKVYKKKRRTARRTLRG